MTAEVGHPLATGLDQGLANHVPLSPVSFLTRAVSAFADRTAVIDGGRTLTYAELGERCRRLASALQQRGVRPLDTVATLAPNIPAMIEAHFAVPMLGAVLNPLNTRLDAGTIAFSLRHGEAKALLVDRDHAGLVKAALPGLDLPPLIVGIDETGGTFGDVGYEALLAEGDPGFAPPPLADEWQSLCLLYTSGTTGDPKGVVYSHRGAYLNALSNALTFRLGPESVYLWTLPMFHCSGWSFPWAVVAVGGVQVCSRRLDPVEVFRLIASHRVTHFCGAPVVLTMLVNTPPEQRTAFDHVVHCATGGAAPPSAVLEAMESIGFRVTHLYGATESYGPATACVPQPDWPDLTPEERYRRMARQGVPNPALEVATVADPATMEPVPRDGLTLGEIMLRGNTVMKGYLKNAAATAKALEGGWYHTGDLGVWHPDGYVEVKDRLKDIIISGGENISSLEVEEVLYRHPAVLEAAVVAWPDPKWGESPCAFVGLKPDAEGADEASIIAWCRERMARFKAPRRVVFGPLPKTSTGKVQKFALRERARTLAQGRSP